MLKIRLQRYGTKNAPVYRVVVAESSTRRDGRFVELLGHYNPRARGQDSKLKLNVERLQYWKSVGAQPTETVMGLVRKTARSEAINGVVTVAAGA